MASGSLSFNLAPGETRNFDAALLSARPPCEQQPCPGYAWTIAWRSTDVLAASWYTSTASTELGRGRWGTSELGNASFRLWNQGSASVYGELNYLIGSR